MSGDSGSGFDLWKAIRSGVKIRFAPGVIGRSSVIIVTTLTLWGLIVWRMSPAAPAWFNGLLAVTMLGIGFFVARELRALRVFAVQNPQLALTEGAQVVQLKALEAQQKGATEPDTSPIVAAATLAASAPVVVIQKPIGGMIPQPSPSVESVSAADEKTVEPDQ